MTEIAMPAPARVPHPRDSQMRYAEAATPDPRPGHYYVSALEGRRFALLLGPYPTHAEALGFVDAARLCAVALDPRAVWWAYGTCRLPEDHPEPPQGHMNRLLAEVPA